MDQDQIDELFKIADEVIAGKWGNGLDRIQKLELSGYDSAKVQNIVNVKLLSMRSKTWQRVR